MPTQTEEFRVLSVLSQSAKPVSKLPYADAILSDDLFLVARPTSEYRQDPVLDEQSLDSILLEQYGIGPDFEFFQEARQLLRYLYDEGWKLQYSSLSARLLTDISARFGFKSMAYRDEWQYSLKNHVHPYSTVRAFAQYQHDPTTMGSPRTTDEWLGTALIHQMVNGSYSETSVDFYMPHVEFPQYPDPYIGEVRFLARTSLPGQTGNPRLTSVYSTNDLLYDEENNGYWAYPKGQTIQCGANQFKAACRVYGEHQTESDTSFTVPSLSNFIKPDASSKLSSALLTIPWQNGLKQHAIHQIDQNSFTDEQYLSVDAKIRTTTNAGTDGVHSGSGNPDPTHIVRHLSATARLTNVTNLRSTTGMSPEELDVETYPEYQNWPAIIYVGRRF